MNYWDDLEPRRSRRIRGRRIEGFFKAAVIWLTSWIASVVVMAVVVVGVHNVGWLGDDDIELLAALLIAVFYSTPTVLITAIFKGLVTNLLGLQR